MWKTEAPTSAASNNNGARLQVELSPDLVVLVYPEACAGAIFDTDYAAASARIRERQSPFALMHDLSVSAARSNPPAFRAALA